MDEKVWGIKGGWKGWMAACQVCGKALEEQVGSGWFCQFNGAARLATGVWLKRNVASSVSSVTVDATLAGQRQQILGFGGAFTDATAYASSLLPSSLATAWHRLYFGQNGSAGYTMGRCAFFPRVYGCRRLPTHRPPAPQHLPVAHSDAPSLLTPMPPLTARCSVPFGGTDFSRTAYSLDDGAPDWNLTRMCLRDDRPNWQPTDCGRDAKIEVIQRATALEPRLRLYFSPWSPPAWMKTTGELKV